jgi:tRNA-splicing ligase RtcB
MGDISVILEGVDGPESQSLLYSTVHGAGRMLGRMQAKGKKDKLGNVIRAPMVDRGMHDAWIKEAGVEVRGGDLDESPFSYKRIEAVLAAHAGTINILHKLRPIGVCMADDREWDPYKD